MPSRIGLVGVFRWQPAAQPMCIPAVPAGVSAGHSIASPCTMPAPAITLQLTEHSMYVTLLSRVILLAYKKKSKVLVFHWATWHRKERKVQLETKATLHSQQSAEAILVWRIHISSYWQSLLLLLLTKISLAQERKKASENMAEEKAALC